MGIHAHFFYALRLSMKTKEELKKYSDELKGNFSFSRWVHFQDYHITFAFLGSAPKERLTLSQQFVKQLLSEIESFPLTIDQLGIFGKKDSPRIFWAGVRREEQLHIVRNQVYAACEQAGFQLETRPFHPHITLARKWQGESPFPSTKLEEENKLFKPLIFDANEVVLYQTHLDQNPKYEAISVYPLNHDL